MKWKINVYRLLIYFLILLCSLTVINISFYRFYRSIMIPLSILVIAFCMSIRVFSDEYKNAVVVVLAFLVLSILLMCFNENAGLGAALNIAELICLHILFKIYGVSKKYIKYISLFFAIECIYIATISKGYGALHYASVSSGTNMYVNTNYMAYMTCIMSFQVWAFIINSDFGNRFLKRLLSIILLLLSIWTISNFDSRSSYIAINFFFILVYFYPNRFITKKMILSIYVGLIIMSFVVPVIYVYMYKHGITIDTVGAIEKNTFTGRELIWQEYVTHFKGIFDWIFGLGSHTEMHYGADMHNMSLSLIKNGGIISAVIVYVYIGKQIGMCIDNTITRERFAYLAAVLASIPIGFFESVFLTSQFLCIFIFLLYEAYGK